MFANIEARLNFKSLRSLLFAKLGLIVVDLSFQADITDSAWVAARSALSGFALFSSTGVISNGASEGLISQEGLRLCQKYDWFYHWITLGFAWVDSYNEIANSSSKSINLNSTGVSNIYMVWHLSMLSVGLSRWLWLSDDVRFSTIYAKLFGSGHFVTNLCSFKVYPAVQVALIGSVVLLGSTDLALR